MGFFFLGFIGIANASSHFDTDACLRLGFQDAESNRPENPDQPRIKQEAFFAFEAIGQQGDWKTFEREFLAACQSAYIEGYQSGKVDYGKQAERMVELAESGTLSEEEIIQIRKNAKNAGYQYCTAEGRNDAINFNPKEPPSEIEKEKQALESFSNLYPEHLNLKKTKAYEVFLFAFSSDCDFYYNDAYKQNVKGEGQIDATDVGRKDGYNDSQCASEGRNDYKNDEPKEPPNVFEIGLRQAEKNPFNIVLEPHLYEEYRVAYENGCNEAYDDAYDKARAGASSSGDGGCLIATAAYGTELSSEVQNLREIRNKMYETELGGEVMHTVNDFYYSFSPTVADWERQNPAFKETVKILITPSMTSFAILDHNYIDSENGLIGYVVGIVSINMGMYFVAPAIVVWQIKKRL